MRDWSADMNKKGSAGASSRRKKVQTHYTIQVRTGACPAKLTERSGNDAALLQIWIIPDCFLLRFFNIDRLDKINEANNLDNEDKFYKQKLAFPCVKQQK